MSRSWQPEVFEQLYASSADPWDYGKSAYESAKYRATLAALGTRRFAAGLEAGCSIGVLTRKLARQCGHLLAVDCAAVALDHARQVCRDAPHVHFRQGVLPHDWPRGRRFSLILFSEILYYLSPADLRRVARRAARSLRPGGMVVLVNWTGPTDSPQTGARAVAGFTAACGLQRCMQTRGARFRIDQFMRVPT